MLGKAYQFVCFLYFIFILDPLTAWKPSEYIFFLEERGYVVGSLRMLNWDIYIFMAQILRHGVAWRGRAQPCVNQPRVD